MSIIPDISHYHPVKDWGLVKASCPFLISKATQGLTYVDPTLDSFIAGSEKHGIPYWLYVFLNKGNERAQAEYMVKVCKDKVGKYFVGYILDVERGNAATDVKKAMDYLQGLGGKYMVYTMYAQHDKYKSILEARPDNCAWWEARYGSNNGYYNTQHPCHAGVDLHQYTSNGKCAGIGKGLDLNRIVQKGEAWYRTKYCAPPSTGIANQAQGGKIASAAGDAKKADYITEVAKAMKEIKKGSTGKIVKVWQTILGNVAVDGNFGPNTDSKTRVWQKSHSLTVDGVVGQYTWKTALKSL